MSDFNALGVLFIRNEDDSVVEEKVILKNITDIKEFFGKTNKTEQVHLSKYKKLYYTMSDIECGVRFTPSDSNGERYYIGKRVLCVLCDENKPINITEEVLKEFRETLGVS